MCTLALLHAPGRRLPLVVAANRDEFLDRPSRPPGVLCTDPWVVAGQDEVAGGTWLGLNEHGVVAGILNRPRPGGPDPRLRSRGLLCLEALQAGSLEAALAAVAGCEPALYNPFHLVLADPERAVYAASDGEHLEVAELRAGAHIFTNRGLDAPDCPRARRALQQLRAIASAEPAPEDLPAVLAPLLRSHSGRRARYPDDLGDGLCIHAGIYGTRSSSIIALGSDGRRAFWTTDGPPCQAAFTAVALPGGGSPGVAAPGCGGDPPATAQGRNRHRA